MARTTSAVRSARRVVGDDRLPIAARLLLYRPQRLPDVRLGVVGGNDHADPGHRTQARVRGRAAACRRRHPLPRRRRARRRGGRLDQEDEPVELVVVDDGSTDPATATALDRLSAEFPSCTRRTPDSARHAWRAWRRRVRRTSSPWTPTTCSSTARSARSPMSSRARRRGFRLGRLRPVRRLRRPLSGAEALPALEPTYVNQYPICSLLRRSALDATGGWRLQATRTGTCGSALSISASRGSRPTGSCTGAGCTALSGCSPAPEPLTGAVRGAAAAPPARSPRARSCATASDRRLEARRLPLALRPSCRRAVRPRGAAAADDAAARPTALALSQRSTGSRGPSSSPGRSSSCRSASRSSPIRPSSCTSAVRLRLS